MFDKGFDSYISHGDTITCDVDGYKLTATIHRDDDAETPWSREDGHGPVSEWRPFDSKRAGERVLNRDRNSARFYDFAEAVVIAKRDGWGAPEGTFRADATPTPGQIAHYAAEADFKNLKAWCEDEWNYVGVAVTVSRKGILLTGKYDHALWGIESTAGDYLREVANDLLDDALDAARARLAELCA